MGEDAGRAHRGGHEPGTRAPLLTRLRDLLDQALELGPADLQALIQRVAREAPDDARELAALLDAEPELDAIRFLCDQPASRPTMDPARPSDGETTVAPG
jgi:hypothetical protein